MVEKRAPVTSDELSEELSKSGVEPSGTTNKKFDFPNIFKPNSQHRKLVKLIEGKQGLYDLSELWGKDFEIVIL